MHDFRAASLTDSQEPNHIHIDEGYLLQVQDELWSVPLELLLQFLNVVRLKAPNQADCRLSTLRMLFDLQFPSA